MNDLKQKRTSIITNKVKLIEKEMESESKKYEVRMKMLNSKRNNSINEYNSIHNNEDIPINEFIIKEITETIKSNNCDITDDQLNEIKNMVIGYDISNEYEQKLLCDEVGKYLNKNLDIRVTICREDLILFSLNVYTNEEIDDLLIEGIDFIYRKEEGDDDE